MTNNPPPVRTVTLAVTVFLDLATAPKTPQLPEHIHWSILTGDVIRYVSETEQEIDDSFPGEVSVHWTIDVETVIPCNRTLAQVFKSHMALEFDRSAWDDVEVNIKVQS